MSSSGGYRSIGGLDGGTLIYFLILSSSICSISRPSNIDYRHNVQVGADWERLFGFLFS